MTITYNYPQERGRPTEVFIDGKLAGHILPLLNAGYAYCPVGMSALTEQRVKDALQAPGGNTPDKLQQLFDIARKGKMKVSITVDALESSVEDANSMSTLVVGALRDAGVSVEDEFPRIDLLVPDGANEPTLEEG